MTPVTLHGPLDLRIGSLSSVFFLQVNVLLLFSFLKCRKNKFTGLHACLGPP